MNSDNEIELAIGTQASEGNAEPVLEQQMQVDSPPRTMKSMQGRMQQAAYVGGIPFLLPPETFLSMDGQGVC